MDSWIWQINDEVRNLWWKKMNDETQQKNQDLGKEKKLNHLAALTVKNPIQKYLQYQQTKTIKSRTAELCSRSNFQSQVHMVSEINQDH